MLDVFDHVTVRVSDVEASRRFYELALAALGYGEPYRGDHFFEWEDLSISAARDERPATRNLHLALLAHSRREVDAIDSPFRNGAGDCLGDSRSRGLSVVGAVTHDLSADASSPVTGWSPVWRITDAGRHR